MRGKQLYRAVPRLLACGLLAVAAGVTAGHKERDAPPDAMAEGAGNGGDPKALQSSADERVRREVRAALTPTPNLEIRDLRVEVQEGTVTLYGYVGSPAEKHLASRFADDVPGSRGVVNVLEVVPGPGPDTVDRLE